MSTLRNAVYDEICEIYKNALRDGYIAHDDISDELGDYWDKVEECNDATLKTAYAVARSAHEEDYNTALKLLRSAKTMLER